MSLLCSNPVFVATNIKSGCFNLQMHLSFCQLMEDPLPRQVQPVMGGSPHCYTTFTKFTQHAFQLIACLLSERSQERCRNAVKRKLCSLNWNVTTFLTLKWHLTRITEAGSPSPLLVNYSEARVLITHHFKPSRESSECCQPLKDTHYVRFSWSVDWSSQQPLLSVDKASWDFKLGWDRKSIRVRIF